MKCTSKQDCVGVAYMRAHNVHAFDQSVLTPHLKAMTFTAWDDGQVESSFDRWSSNDTGSKFEGPPEIEEIFKYVERSMQMIRDMRFYKMHEVEVLLNNLKYLPESFHIQKQVTSNLEQNAETIYRIWLEDAETSVMKELQETASYHENKAQGLEIQEWTRRTKELQVLSKVMNECLFPDVYKMMKDYMEMFSMVLVNPKNVVGKKMVQLSTQKIQSFLWSKEVIDRFIDNYSVYHEADIKAEYFQQAFNCYSVLRRFLELVDPMSNLHAQVFHDFSEAWLNLGIKKAKVQIRRLISQARHDETDGGINSMDLGVHQTKIEEDDHVGHQLVTFLGISESCWKLWETLTYTDSDEKAKCFLILVDGLKDLEINFIRGKESMYLADKILDAAEMTKQVSLLDGLEMKFEQGKTRLEKMRDDIHVESMNENLEAKCAQGLTKLNEMRDMLDEEIDKCMIVYAKSYEEKLQVFVTSKDIETSYEDSAACFLDAEMRKIHHHFGKNFVSQEEKKQVYSQKACLILWNQFESQLLGHFEAKKMRNQEKNKPGRFSVLKHNIVDIIELKKIAIESGIMAQTSCDKIFTMQEQLEHLTMSTTKLISSFLRQKEAEERESESVESTGISFIIGYNQEEDKVVLEMKSIFKLVLGDKDKIKLEFNTTVFPPEDNHKLMTSSRRSVHVFQESHIFDIPHSGEENEKFIIDVPLKNRRFADPEFDCFICVDVYHKHHLRSDLLLGDVIIQVVKGGQLVEGINELGAGLDIVPGTNFTRRTLSKEGEQTYHNKDFMELRDRKDDLARSFNKWQKKEKINNS